MHTKQSINSYGTLNFHYCITVFFCGCNFLPFLNKICSCNFCNFFFCNFTPWQYSFYSLDDIKKLLVNLSHPDFFGASAFTDHFPLYWTHRSNQAETPVLCSCEQKLLVQEWPKPLVRTCLDLNYISLDRVYLTTVSRVGVWNFVWVVHAFINENSTHHSETKITDKWFFFFISYFSTLYSTPKMYEQQYKV